MYPNLRAEMARNNITAKDLTKVIDASYGTVCNCLKGKSIFRSDQCFEIKEKFFPDLTVDYLFKSDND